MIHSTFIYLWKYCESLPNGSLSQSFVAILSLTTGQQYLMMTPVTHHPVNFFHDVTSMSPGSNRLIVLEKMFFPKTQGKGKSYKDM